MTYNAQPPPRPKDEREEGIPLSEYRDLLSDKERLIAALKAILRGAKVQDNDIESFFYELLQNKNLRRALNCLPRLEIYRRGGSHDEHLMSPIQNRRMHADTLSEMHQGKHRHDEFISVDDRAHKRDGNPSLRQDGRLNDPKLGDKTALNDQLAEKNIKLLEERQRLKDQLNAMKQQLKKYKAQEKGKESTKSVRSVEQSRGLRNETPGVTAQREEENQRLREENVVLTTRIETYRDNLKLKKKILLNELVNFVNSKNNFENSCYSELTKHSLNH